MIHLYTHLDNGVRNIRKFGMPQRQIAKIHSPSERSKNSLTTTGYKPKRYHWSLVLILSYCLMSQLLRNSLLKPLIVLRQNAIMPSASTRTLTASFKGKWESTSSVSQKTRGHLSRFSQFRCTNPVERVPIPSKPLTYLFPFRPLTMTEAESTETGIPATPDSKSSSGGTTPLSTGPSPGDSGFLKTPIQTPTLKDVTMNGITFTKKKTRTFELGAFAETVTPKYRETLSGKALFDFRNEAVAALDDHFTLSTASIRVTDDKTFFVHNNKVMKQLYNLKTRLTSYCMQSVFAILPIDPSTGDLDETKPTVSIIDKACILSEAQVRLSNQAYAENSDSRLHPQNLSWSQDLLLSSCDASLRADLEHRLISIPENEQGGPLILHMVLNQLMSTTHEAARNIIRRLETHSVTDYPGENIANFCATFNNAVMRLSVSGHVPTDIANIFFIQLQTCTVPKFLSLLEAFENTDAPILSDFMLLRERVIKKYNDLLLANKWLPTTIDHASSSFQSKSSSPQGKSGDSGSGGRRSFPIDTTPPADGAANWRPHPGNPSKKQYWCGLCPNGLPNGLGRWGNHSTDRHDPNKVKQRTRTTANRTSTTPTPTTTAAPNTSTSSVSDDTAADDSNTGTTASVALLSSLRDFS